jgi:hypothetical protein
MEKEDRALQGTENAGMFWGVVYFLVFAVLLIRIINIWRAAHSQSFDWAGISENGMNLIYGILPGLVGLMFRKTLKKELNRGMLSDRTYKICNWHIALLLFFTYMGMMAPTGPK